MEKKYYSLKKDILTLKTPCGPIRFQIENQELLKQAHHIGDLVMKELNAVNDKLASEPGTTNHYATLLLAALNLAEKYIRIEAQCQVLHQEIKVLQKKEDARLNRETFLESQSVAIKLDSPVEITNTDNPSTTLASSHPRARVQNGQPDQDEPILLTDIVNEDENRGGGERSLVPSKSDTLSCESISSDTLPCGEFMDADLLQASPECSDEALPPARVIKPSTEQPIEQRDDSIPMQASHNPSVQEKLLRDGDSSMNALIDSVNTATTTEDIAATADAVTVDPSSPTNPPLSDSPMEAMPDPSMGDTSDEDLFESEGAEGVSENQNTISQNADSRRMQTLRMQSLRM